MVSFVTLIIGFTVLRRLIIIYAIYYSIFAFLVLHEQSLQHTPRNGTVLSKSSNILHHSLNDLNNVKLHSSFIQLPHSNQSKAPKCRQGSLKDLNISVEDYSGVTLNDKNDDKAVQQQQYCKPSTSKGFCLPFPISKNVTHYYDGMVSEMRPTDDCHHGGRVGYVVCNDKDRPLNYHQGHQHHCSKAQRFTNNKCLQYSFPCHGQQQTCCHCCSCCCATAEVNPLFDRRDFDISASNAQPKRRRTKSERQREEEFLSQSVTSAVTINGGIPDYGKGFKQHGKKTRLINEIASYAHGRTKSLDNVAK